MKDMILAMLKDATSSYQRSIMHEHGTKKKAQRLQDALDYARVATLELERQVWLQDPNRIDP